jgi:hypothetical protein
MKVQARMPGHAIAETNLTMSRKPDYLKDPKKVKAGKIRAQSFDREHQVMAGRAGYAATVARHPEHKETLLCRARLHRMEHPSLPERTFMTLCTEQGKTTTRFGEFKREYNPIPDDLRVTLDFAWPQDPHLDRD